MLRDRPPTRQGILSTVSSVFDPLGFISPVILKGKQKLQKVCKAQYDWDTQLPEDIVNMWQDWCCDLRNLEQLEIPDVLSRPTSEKIQ